ncbi:MAG: protein kinase [Legionella longbeachae]|nr:protein kinase [Legionella longbeachae]
MGILQQVKSDAEFLRKLILTLTSQYSTVTTNDVRLSGEQLERALALAREQNRSELKKLELILESQIVPNKYYSIITKQTYYPSSEELKQQSEIIPLAKHTYFSLKKSRKNTDLSNSYYKLSLDGQNLAFRFFIEHKNDKSYPKGGFAAKVKKGFSELDSTEPKYAVKIYHKNMFSGDTIHELRLAMRASYCYKQLGREGYAFRRNNKQYMVTEWLSGVNLNIADQDQVQTIPVARRIVMAISLLRELNILHKQGLIHNDIKPSNVMINFGKLNFVDLDSVRVKNEVPLCGSVLFTESYLQTAQMSFDAVYNPRELYLQFNEKTDMYAMGLTLAHLFQEIYIPKNEAQVIKVQGGSGSTHTFNTFSLRHGPKYKEHPELQKLLKNMVFQEQDNLSTAENYIEALKIVLSNYSDHEQYLEEDRLVGLGSGLSPEDGEKAFREIEIELLGYNQRIETINKLSI